MNEQIKKNPFNFRSFEFGAFLAILVLGMFLRFTDLTDPPLDFHAMRQLRSAIIARNFYYQMLPNADPGLAERALESTYIIEPQEPPILEHVVAFTYLISGEHPWVARVYSIIFWIIAGIVFFLLATHMVGVQGGLVSFAYIMLLPFSVVVSRVFQPEPFLVMWIALTLLVSYQWGETRTWKWAVATGLLVGWTILVKITAVFFLAPALIAIVLTRWSVIKAIRDRWVWLAAGIAIAIPAIYYFGIIGGQSASWFSGWGLSFTDLLLQPRFYISWIKYLDYLLDLTLIGFGLIGILLTPRTKDRILLISLWFGYMMFGLSFPYPIRTHEYYSIMMIVVVGLSLASVGKTVVDALFAQPLIWRWLAIPVIIVIIAYPSWLTYTGFIGVNYDNEIIAWKKMGEELPEGSIIGLTHDYGYRIGYYGMRLVYTWPTSDDFAMLSQRNQGYSWDLENLFMERTAGMDFFLVTLMGELDNQSDLKELLYGNYPLYAEGDGYLLFDLKHPLNFGK